MAAKEGHNEAVKLLLAKGADPTLKDKDNHIALDIAKLNGHADTAALLEGHLAALPQFSVRFLDTPDHPQTPAAHTVAE